MRWRIIGANSLPVARRAARREAARDVGALRRGSGGIVDVSGLRACAAAGDRAGADLVEVLRELVDLRLVRDGFLASDADLRAGQAVGAEAEQDGEDEIGDDARHPVPALEHLLLAAPLLELG